MQLQSRFPMIEAIQISVEGQDYYAARKDVLDTLYTSEASRSIAHAKPIEVVATAPKPKRTKVGAAKKAVRKSAPADVSSPSDGTVEERITAALRKRPMSSAELLEQIKAGTGSVYTSLSAMRKSGRVETKEDPADGLRKNFLVEAA